MVKSKFLHNLYRIGVQLTLIGVVTGVAVGVIVTFFNLAADYILDFTQNVYTDIRSHLYFIPLLFAVLALAAFLMAVLVKLMPMLRSNGVSQVEAVTRGLVNVKWYKALPSMVAAGLMMTFMGVSSGMEKPSMFIGGMCGDGVGSLLGLSDMDKRYQITGGACAGVAVATNAPLTGVVFVLEEAHHHVTPAILIVAFASAISSVITRNLLLGALGLETASSFVNFTVANPPMITYLYVAFAALICGLFGIAVFKLARLTRKMMSKMTHLGGFLRMLLPFVFAGAAGLVTVYAMGGGHALIEALGTNGGAHPMRLLSINNSAIWATLVVIIVLRVAGLCLNTGSDMPVGIFFPTLAIGACLGALLARLCVLMGMNPAFADLITLVGLATVFATIIKTPFSAILMVVEFTWQATVLLPVALGVFVGYILSEVFRHESLYEVMMEDLLQDLSARRGHHEFSATILPGSAAQGRPIREVLWPENMRISSLKREGETIVPTADTVLLADDVLYFEGDAEDVAAVEQRVHEILSPAHFNNAKHLKNEDEQETRQDDGDNAENDGE